MTKLRLLTYALGILATTAAFLVPHPQALVMLLPVGTGLLGLATKGPWDPPQQPPVDKS